MSRKLDPVIVARLEELYFVKGLPPCVIQKRLGISERAMFYYLAAAKQKRAAAAQPVGYEFAEAA